MVTTTPRKDTDMRPIKDLICRYPDWLRRHAHRTMLLAMVRRLNAERKSI
jgi:hypothetical protein